jgi:PBSX family phage terminase large subunit
MILKEFSAKQKQIFNFSEDSNRYLICDGAVRSGKTVPMTLAFITYAMNHFTNTKFAICSKTTQTAERNIIDPLLSLEGFPFAMKYNRVSHTLAISSWQGTNQFHIFGGNDEKSQQRIQGVTLASVLFDEVALMPESFVNQALARQLTFPQRKTWLNCNPEGPSHWFYKGYIEEKKPLTKYLHFTMTDNPIMTPESIQSAKESFTGVFFKRYIEGLWCVAEGAIYQVFSEDREKYFVDTVPNIYTMQINVGLDFGGNKSKHALTASAIDLANKELYVLKSESFSAKGVTPEDLYDRTQTFISLVQSEWGEVHNIYADSAEQTLINGLKSRCSVPVLNSIKNPINDRIRCTTGLMAGKRFHMIKDRCSDLIDAFEAAVWDEKKNTEDKRLDNGSYDVDILDSFEYSFERYLRQLSREVIEFPKYQLLNYY